MLRTNKYYFMGGELVKILHSSPSFNEIVVMNYDKREKETLSFAGAELVAQPALKIGEVAKLLHKSPDAIRKWESRGWILPQKQWNLSANKSVRFYSTSDVEAIRDVVQYIHVGRPRKDKRVTNPIPSKGNLKQILRERMKQFNV